MKWALDLFSGLGGASEAFVMHPAWRVVRVDNNDLLKDIPHTRMHDILNWMDWLPGLVEEMGSKPNLVWASPECKFFSLAYNSPRSMAERAGEEYQPDMSQVQAVKDILDYLGPQWWIVENVAGACTYFPPYFGELSLKIRGVFLWGVFPHLSLPEGWTHSKFDNDVSANNPMRYNIRSKIPIEISRALCTAVQSQTTLDLYCLE